MRLERQPEGWLFHVGLVVRFGYRFLGEEQIPHDGTVRNDNF